MNTWRNASLAVTAAAVLTLTTACGQEKGTENPNGQAVGVANPAGQPADPAPSSAERPTQPLPADHPPPKEAPS